MLRITLLSLVLAFTISCGEASSSRDQAVQDERDRAMVRQANDTPPPLRAIAPEPIHDEDWEFIGIKDDGCRFALGMSNQIRVITQPVLAYARIDGKMQRFAADPGSSKLPAGTFSQYAGRGYVLQLKLASPDDSSPVAEDEVEGTVTLRDPWGRIVFSGQGPASCTAPDERDG